MSQYQIVCEQLQHAPKTWLVTGVAGFIGSAVANAFLAQGNEIVGVDNMSTGYPENISSKIDFSNLETE